MLTPSLLFLQERGAELHGVHIRPSAAGSEWGLGVYTTQQGCAADDGEPVATSDHQTAF